MLPVLSSDVVQVGSTLDSSVIFPRFCSSGTVSPLASTLRQRDIISTTFDVYPDPHLSRPSSAVLTKCGAR